MKILKIPNVGLLFKIYLLIYEPSLQNEMNKKMSKIK